MFERKSHFKKTAQNPQKYFLILSWGFRKLGFFVQVLITSLNTPKQPPLISKLAVAFDSEINNDQQKIINWLASIGEDDQGMIDETIDRCKADPETLSYYLQRADGIANPR